MSVVVIFIGLKLDVLLTRMKSTLSQPVTKPSVRYGIFPLIHTGPSYVVTMKIFMRGRDYINKRFCKMYKYMLESENSKLSMLLRIRQDER